MITTALQPANQLSLKGANMIILNQMINNYQAENFKHRNSAF